MSTILDTQASAIRAGRLAIELDERGLDALIVDFPVDVRYLTGFTGDNGLALIRAPGRGEHRFLTDFRDEILAVVRQVRIAGALDTDRVRHIAEQTVDELFSLMKRPSTNE